VFRLSLILIGSLVLFLFSTCPPPTNWRERLCAYPHIVYHPTPPHSHAGIGGPMIGRLGESWWGSDCRCSGLSSLCSSSVVHPPCAIQSQAHSTTPDLEEPNADSSMRRATGQTNELWSGGHPALLQRGPHVCGILNFLGVKPYLHQACWASLMIEKDQVTGVDFQKVSRSPNGCSIKMLLRRRMTL